MTPIFDPSAEVVGWLEAGIVHDLGGYAIAFLQGENLYNYDGAYLGRFHQGYFRDAEGHAVAFTYGASAGPLLPLTPVPPLPPLLQLAPLRPIPELPPLPALSTLYWSDLDWEEFIGETEEDE